MSDSLGPASPPRAPNGDYNTGLENQLIAY